jgi:hypothetical protein
MATEEQVTFRPAGETNCLSPPGRSHQAIDIA